MMVADLSKLVNAEGFIHAITLWEPWATFMALEVKAWETRGWKPPASFNGTLLIHAAARPPTAGRFGDWVVHGDRMWGPVGDCRGNGDCSGHEEGQHWHDLQPRKLVAAVKITEVLPMRDVSVEPTEVGERIIRVPVRDHLEILECMTANGFLFRENLEHERALGIYFPGRFAWHAEKVDVIMDSPDVIGLQKLWKYRP